MSPSTRKKDVLVLAASLVAHVVALAFAIPLAQVKPGRSAVIEAPANDLLVADLELGLDPLQPALPKRTDQGEATARPGPAMGFVSHDARLGRLTPGAMDAPAAPGEPGLAGKPAEPSEPGKSSPVDAPHDPSTEAPTNEPPRPRTLTDLGVGKNPFVPGRGTSGVGAEGLGAAGTSAAGDPREPARSAKERVEASLRAEARAHEAALGLGPDGPVRAALTDAMYASDAPVLARVVFAIRADAQGKVLSIDAVSADQGLPAFQGMARLAREKLARTTLRLPSSAKGANLRVEVTSAWKLPSGHDPGASVELFGQKLTKGEGSAATKIALLPMPKVTCISPDDPKNDLKLPLCGISVPLFATDGDPADIGAKPRRIVSTKVVESTVL